MASVELLTQIEELEKEIVEKKQQLVQLRKSLPERSIMNYDFITSMNERVTLLDLFGEWEELFIVHNMGKSCSYCTMWADGLNGVYHHLVGKASFVLASPDAPEVQADFAAERKWQFPMISIKESSFTADVGFKRDTGWHPGVSTFRRDEQGNIYLHAQARFGPGDDYCVPWHLFDLLPSGAKDVKVQRKLNTQTPFQLTSNIAIGVKDYDAAISFYQDIIGMKVEQMDEGEAKLTISGTNFYMENSKENNVFFEFAVDNMESAIKQLLENGCTLTKKYNEKSMMIQDPYGMKFHLFESK